MISSGIHQTPSEKLTESTVARTTEVKRAECAEIPEENYCTSNYNMNRIRRMLNDDDNEYICK